MSQTITALYDVLSQAEAAQAKLVSAGIPQSAIRLVPGNRTGTAAATAPARDESFWGSLKDMFMPEEDRHTYQEGLSRGGTMLTATVEQAQIETAYDIVEQHGSVDLDEREATWRKEGWSGYTGETAAGATATTGALRNPTTAEVAGGIPATGGTAAFAAGERDGMTNRETVAGTAGDTEYIPVVEERLNVGKRVADSGRVRVRSYAIEKPVEEQVTLRDETVHVDRRAVDRAPTPVDEALFAEKTIEATEMREQAVVSKEARVVEEVGIRKQAADRVETVSDTVRHTEVEVTDERGNTSRTGTTGSTTGTDPRKPL